MPLRITLGDLLNKKATKFADRPFLTIAESGLTLSYGEFETLTNRFAHGLIAAGQGRLSHVAILAENGIEYLASSYALKKLNAIEVSINCAMRGAPLARMIDQTKAQVLIMSAVHLDALNQIRDNIRHLRVLIMIDGLDEATDLFPELEIASFDDFLSDRDDHIVSPAKDSDTATILFTSGTTGVSKGCLLSHRYAVRTAENMIEPFRITGDDCVYSPYPLSHIGPAYYDVLPTMMTGGRVVLRKRFSVSNFWPEVKRYGVTWFLMLGSVQQMLWANPVCSEESDHKVTRCWGTPAPVPKKDFDARFNLNLIPGGGYGSTDAGWVVVPQWDHPGGIVLPHFEVAIVDENDDALPANTPGEMVIRPLEPGVMSDGYFDMPELTLESWRNLWFHTGDVARIDEVGRFYFLHRMSERIRVKGEMVSGYEVEEGVLTHPSVKDCAVIGVPGEMGEEDIKLFVVRKQDVELTVEDLRQHCAGCMAKFMVPKYVIFLDSLPLTSTGKPEKGKLAQM
jgi:crotonobetaine/carnitine-CoA ligase